MKFKKLHSYHRGLFSVYNIGMTLFFIIALVLVVIYSNIGFQVNQTQKEVVEKAVDQVDDHFVVAGKISAAANVSSNKLIATATPVKPVSDGPIHVDPKRMTVSYKLVQLENYVINYENIYGGAIPDKSYNSLREAVADAKNLGIINVNPFVDQQKPDTTTAFVYWIVNQNFDNFVDNDELAVFAIVYADKDRPSSGEQLFIQADVPEGYVLRIEQDVPNISGDVLNFGGVVGGW
jgi:flagellin FlaB